MKKIITCVLFVTFFILINKTYAQNAQRVISGKIISFEESFPLEGVAVAIKGRSYATGTQADGTFSLNVLPEDKVLVVSLSEYQTTEIKITNDKNYDIILKRVGNGVQLFRANEFNQTLMLTR